MLAAEEFWPPFALRIEAGPLELRAVRDDDIGALADLALTGVHDPGVMPFAVPWTDASRTELPHAMAAYYWSSRTAFCVTSWTLDMTVRRDGEIVGVQGVSTKDYLVTRTGETGSWLGRVHQGKSTGTLMRQAICAFLFDSLDAEEVTSAAFADNPASLAVSEKVGFTENGVTREQRRDGELAICRKLRLTRDAFMPGPNRLVVEGVETMRTFIGLS